MITLTGENRSNVSVHQIEVDSFEITVTDKDQNESICYLSEKQMKSLAETLNNYLDM